jgi:hypothetical protein
MRSLKDVLIDDFSLGASLACWTLTSADDISADGQFIVGSGINPSGNTEAWLAGLVPALPGDFNNNATVDAADYVVWRKGLGTIYTAAGYDDWRAHFGENAAGGASERLSGPLPAADRTSMAAPEQPTAAMFSMAMVAAFCRRRPICRTCVARVRRAWSVTQPSSS